jgi:single-strand DNA-binding protein
MSASLNRVFLIGNVGKDPEIRSFQNCGRIASFSVATSESWKDKTTGEKKERAEWHRISVLNDALVGIVESYVRKGAKIFVEGQLETRKWTDQAGQEKYSTEVVLRPYRGNIVLLGDKSGNTQPARAPQTQAQAYGAAYSAQAPDPANAQGFPAGGSAAYSDIDDDIPF